MEKPAPLTVVETESFERAARKIKLSDDEFFKIADYLSRNPDAGDRVQCAAGVRKVRFASHGKGKSGGYRTIHYFMDTTKPVFLFSIYDKSYKADLSAKEKKQFAAMAKELKDALSRK